MSVAHQSASASHTSGSWSASQASFSWSHAAGGTPRGVVVMVSTGSATKKVTGVTYGGVAMTEIAAAAAVDATGEPMRVDVFHLTGASLPTGTQTVVVSRANDAILMTAECVTQTAAADTELTGFVLLQDNGAYAVQSVTDGSTGVDSVRYAACYYGGTNPPPAGTGSTLLHSNDFGLLSISFVRETTAGQGARNVGCTQATSDDRAGTHFAVREVVVAPTIQEAYRFRDHTNASVTINSTSWGPAQNTALTAVNPGRRFRLRVQIGSPTAWNSKSYKLQYRINAGGWADVAVNSPGARADETSFSAVEMTENSGYTDAAATTDLLTGGTGTFVAGQGKDLGNAAAAVSLNNQHTEHEWSLWVNRWAGNAESAFVNDGDTIEFRVVESDNTLISTYSVTPSVTVDVPLGNVGGMHVENPAGIGPFKSADGDLYFISEPYENAPPTMVMWRSADGGDVWAPVDQANNPAAVDLEGIAIRPVSDIQHIGHWGTSAGGIDGVYYHRFSMSSDTWVEKDTVVDNGGGVDVPRRDQAITMEVKSNGDVVMVYHKADAGPTNFRIVMRRRISGTWDTTDTVLWAAADGAWTGVTSVIDPNTDIVYVFAHDDTAGDMFGKAILANGTLQNLFADTVTGDGTLVDASVGTGTGEEMNYTRPVFWNDGSPRVFVAWRDPTSTRLEGCRITVGSGGSVGSVVAISDAAHILGINVTASRQPPASIVVTSGDELLCVYAYTDTPDWGESELAYVTSTDGGAAWSSATTGIARSWGSRVSHVSANVFTHSAGNGGAAVAGFVYYDASGYEEDELDFATTGGGHHGGWCWYDELELPGSTPLNQVTSTETAQPFGRVKARTLGQATVADTAQPVTRSKLRPVAQVASTETAQPFTRSKLRPVAQVASTETAQPITSGATTIPVNQVTSTDTAQPFTRSKVRTVGQVTSTDTAQPVARSKIRTVGQALEASIVNVIARVKIRGVGQVTSGETAQPFTRSKLRPVAQAATAETAQPITSGGGTVVPLNQVTSTDTAQPFTRSKVRPVGQVTSTDTAQPVARSKIRTVSQALEAAAAGLITRIRIRQVGQATSTDTAQPFTRSKVHPVGQATSTETAQPVTLGGPAGIQPRRQDGEVTAVGQVGTFLLNRQEGGIVTTRQEGTIT